MNYYSANVDSSRSIMGRLLWSVNVISLVCLSILCFVIILSNKQQIEETTRSKAESISSFLQSVGANYVVSLDGTTLDSFARTVTSDNDFAYVIYYDKDGKSLTSSTSPIESNNILRIQKQIIDKTGRSVGSVVIGARTDRIRNSIWRITLVCIGASILVQLILSGAVLLISRGIVRPLNKTLSRLGKTAGTLADTSHDISRFSESLSKGVNEQGEVVQETTAAMAEMSSMLNQTSTFAKASDNVMAGMTQKANNGMLIMNQMVEAMSSVQQANEQLKQMVDMIQEITTKTNVINDIVFKTQLLSFNASIEAARAGQHGRGFAVVAEEVGNLAKMSGKAAQEIGTLLQDSERQVNDIVKSTYDRVSVGRSVTEQALKNFKDIAQDIGTIASHIENITTAAREQELGVAQTTQAMSELSKTTELNNQVAQQASDAANTLRVEIQTLNSIARDIQTSITGAILRARRAWAPNWVGFRDEQEVEETPQEKMPNDEMADLSQRVVEMAKRHGGRSSSTDKASNQ